MDDRTKQLEEALQAFLALDWAPDAAPGPSCYLVSPVLSARKALQTAGKLINGQSPFPSDIDGSLMVTTYNGSEHKAVWLGGKVYGEDQAHLVPDHYKTTYLKALGRDGGATPPAG